MHRETLKYHKFIYSKGSFDWAVVLVGSIAGSWLEVVRVRVVRVAKSKVFDFEIAVAVVGESCLVAVDYMVSADAVRKEIVVED